MENNHEECSNDITLENLKFEYKLTEFVCNLCRKSSNGTRSEVVSLAFSNFL